MEAFAQALVSRRVLCTAFDSTMRKVLHFPSPRERYKCDAAVVWCYDHRFEMALRKLLKRLSVERSDPIRVAGGAKSLAHPDKESDRQFILEQLRWSMRLHGTDNVLLMVHSDSAAYAGLATFIDDPYQKRHPLKAASYRTPTLFQHPLPQSPPRPYLHNFT